MWTFYLTVEGNEEALFWLRERIEYFGLEETYIVEDPIPEADAEVLLKHTDIGYRTMYFENGPAPSGHIQHAEGGRNEALETDR